MRQSKDSKFACDCGNVPSLGPNGNSKSFLRKYVRNYMSRYTGIGLGRGGRRRGTVAYLAGYKRSRYPKVRRAIARKRRRVNTMDIVVAQEMKYVDGFLASTAPVEQTGANDDWTGTELNPNYDFAGGPTAIGCLPIPGQGDGFAQRDGRKIFLDNIKIRGIINFEPETDMTASTTTPFIRLVVVHDAQTNGVELSGEDVLGPGADGGNNAAVLANAAIMALTKPTGWSRYKILSDQIYMQSTQSGMATCTDVTAAVPIYGEKNGQEIPFKITIKPKCYVNFSGTTGVVGSVIDNSFHLLAMKSNSSGSATISYIARTSFKG